MCFLFAGALLPSCPLRVSLHFLLKWWLDIDRDRKPHESQLPSFPSGSLCQECLILHFLQRSASVAPDQGGAGLCSVYSNISLFLKYLFVFILHMLAVFSGLECVYNGLLEIVVFNLYVWREISLRSSDCTEASQLSLSGKENLSLAFLQQLEYLKKKKKGWPRF